MGPVQTGDLPFSRRIQACWPEGVGTQVVSEWWFLPAPWFSVRALVSEWQLCSWLARGWCLITEGSCCMGLGSTAHAFDLTLPSVCAPKRMRAHAQFVFPGSASCVTGAFSMELRRERMQRLCRDFLPSCPPSLGESPHHLLQGALRGTALAQPHGKHHCA